VPSRKQKLKALQDAEKEEEVAASGSKKMKRNDNCETFVTPPRRISASSAPNSGKRVKIALNKNQAQTAHEYIKQVKQSPNLPTNNLLKKPIKSVLKPNSLPSPINPFYQKKLANFNKTF
jgi:ribosomal RNA-processing protein 1